MECILNFIRHFDFSLISLFSHHPLDILKWILFFPCLPPSTHCFSPACGSSNNGIHGINLALSPRRSSQCSPSTIVIAAFGRSKRRQVVFFKSGRWFECLRRTLLSGMCAAPTLELHLDFLNARDFSHGKVCRTTEFLTRDK